MLVGISLLFLTINGLSGAEVQGGLIGDNPTFTSLGQDFNVLENNFIETRESLKPVNILGVEAILIPFQFINVAITMALITAKLTFILLTGWTEVIGAILIPFDLCCSFGTLGFVLIAILGAIEVYFLFRFVIIIASVIRGGGG